MTAGRGGAAIGAVAAAGAPRVLHLSDFHLLERDARRQRFLAELAELPVDLVVVTGDILGEPAALEVSLEILGRFQPRIGRVAVLGSNDFYSPQFKNYFAYFLPRRPRRLPKAHNPWRELVAGLERSGWLVLANRRARVDDLD